MVERVSPAGLNAQFTQYALGTRASPCKRAEVASQAVTLGEVGAARGKGIEGAGLFFDQVYWRSNKSFTPFPVFLER